MIHGTRDHIGTRHYLHARNLADGIVFLLKRPVTMFYSHSSDYVDQHGFCVGGTRPDRYNIATPDRIDNLTLARTIANYAGKPLDYELVDFHSTRPGHDPHYGLDPQLMEELGWTPPVPLETSLKKTVEWTLRHPEWLLAD
jgi:dTDP-glucose 4,6-dehydratase